MSTTPDPLDAPTVVQRLAVLLGDLAAVVAPPPGLIVDHLVTPRPARRLA